MQQRRGFLAETGYTLDKSPGGLCSCIARSHVQPRPLDRWESLRGSIRIRRREIPDVIARGLVGILTVVGRQICLELRSNDGR